MTALETYVVVVLGVLGLLVGSFLNVVVWRVPRGESVVHPPSACPRCGARVRPWDNVPVVAWLVLRGRCRDCGEPISARYPLVEGLTGLLFAGVALRLVVATDLAWAVPAYLYLVAIGVALALIDLDVRRLPDAIVLPSFPVLAVLLAVASAGLGDWAALLRALVGGVGLFVLYFGLMLVKEGAMGYGDVKLAGLLGAALAWLGWPVLATGAFGGFLVGGLFSIGLIVAGRGSLASRIPFGPWMVLGAFLGVAVGDQAWQAYVGLLV